AALARVAARRQAAARARLSTEVVELLESAPELIVHERDGEQLRRVGAADAALGRITRVDALSAGLAEGAVDVLTGLTTLAVLVAGVAATEAGTLPGVLLAAVALLATAAFEAVRPLPESARHLAGSAGAARRLLELTDREPPVRDPARPLPPPAGELLRVTNVRVRYSQDGPWALDGVDLELRPGSRVALVGASGAGKSTLAALLVRFRDPDAGTVTLDGHDLARYAQDDVRRLVTLAGQQAHLFHTTISENVRLARPEAGQAEVEDALRRARALDWVRSLPDGMETDVGEHGSLVSGGQRQRIALARALLSNARFLVLDEPAAHLDPGTADDLVADVLDATAGRGVLLITHTLRGLAGVDEIVVLDRGRVVERGRHADLVARGGHFARLCGVTHVAS
ncbi:cysteine export CydDC family ABC transporter permease subunit/ATP-binding protein CydC, partial [Saccharomonospora marina XMU15]